MHIGRFVILILIGSCDFSRRINIVDFLLTLIDDKELKSRDLWSCDTKI